MKQLHSFAQKGCMVLMLLISSAAYSSEDSDTTVWPSYYPATFQKLGTLTEIRGQYDWIVNGIRMQVSSNVLVHTLASNFSSLYYIKQGMELGYRKNADGENIEVWQVPNGTADGE
jgi:hypothetical protein